MASKKLLIIIAGTLLFSINTSKACTEILIKAKDASVVNVRSMEFEIDLKSTVNLQPRGETFTSITSDSTPGLQWTNKYGYVYMNTLGYHFALDGLNEAGLSFGALYLPGYTVYQKVPSGESNKALWTLDFGSWVLCNFSTVEEVENAIKSAYVCQIKALANISSIHYNITDASAKSIIIEYTAKGATWQCAWLRSLDILCII